MTHRPGYAAGGASEFTFCTVQYESGDWDSAPMLPANAPVLAAPFASVAIVWRHPILRWIAISSFAYSAVQLCLTGFLVTYLVSRLTPPPSPETQALVDSLRQP